MIHVRRTCAPHMYAAHVRWLCTPYMRVVFSMFETTHMYAVHMRWMFTAYMCHSVNTLLDSDSAHYRPCCHILLLHWDSMFKKIQWTFSIYFLNSNDLVSIQYYDFYGPMLWVRSVALSMLHMSQTDNHWLYLQLLQCKLNTCSAVEKC